MAFQLSEGSLPIIMNGGTVENPIMQILGTRKMSGNGSTARYRLLVSDGLYVNSFAMLTSSLNDKITEGELEENCVIRIERYITSNVPNSGKGEKRVMIILQLAVVASGAKVGGRIGDPKPLGPDGQIPAAAGVPARTSPQRAPPTATHTAPSVSAPRTPTNLRQPKFQTAELSPSCQTHPIASLTPYQNKWVVKARVTNKSAVKTWSNAKGEGKLFSFELLDESGEIRVTAFKEQCDKFFDVIEVGKVYLVARGSLKTANKQWSACKNDYEMTLNSESQITLVDEDAGNIPTVKFNFVPLSTVEGSEPNTFVDIIGICKSVGDLQTFTARTSNKEVKKREIAIVDKSLVSVSLVLWGSEAQDFVCDGQPVIAIKGGTVNEFNGSKTVSVYSSCTLLINPEIPEAYQLKGWYDNEGSSLDFKNVSLRTGGVGADGKLVSLSELKSQQAEQGDSAAYYSCKATIVVLKNENALYNACPGENCSKKVVDLNNGMYRCEKCNREYPDYSPRLLLSMGLADWSSFQWVTCFNETAEGILGHSAAQLNDFRNDDPEEFSRVFQEATFNDYTFRLRAQEQTYNDERRMKVNVMAAKDIDYAEYAKKLLVEMKELYEGS